MRREELERALVPMGVRVSTRACPIFLQGEAGCVSLPALCGSRHEWCVKKYWLEIDFLVKGGVVTTVLKDERDDGVFEGDLKLRRFWGIWRKK